MQINIKSSEITTKTVSVYLSKLFFLYKLYAIAIIFIGPHTAFTLYLSSFHVNNQGFTSSFIGYILFLTQLGINIPVLEALLTCIISSL